jgi:outer membrane protein assembly factor BamB
VLAAAKAAPPATVTWKVPGYAWGRPAVDGDSVFFLSNQHDVTAVNAANGAVRWTQKTGEPDAVIGAGITVGGGNVIAGDYNVTAFDRATGSLRWRFVPALGYAPGAYLGGVQNGVVFAGSGSVMSTQSTCCPAPRGEHVHHFRRPSITYYPVPAGDIVIATFTKNNAPTTGRSLPPTRRRRERWRTMFPVTAAATAFVGTGASGSAVVDNLVIASNRDGIVYALRRSDGSTARTLAIATATGGPAPVAPVTGLPTQATVRADGRARTERPDADRRIAHGYGHRATSTAGKKSGAMCRRSA